MPKTVNPLLRRTSSQSKSPFSTAQRTKPGSRSNSLAEKEERLEDAGGLVPSLAPRNIPQELISLIRFAQSSFEDVPDRAAGMNSERISETLRFRRALPPIVSIAHLLALSKSPTETERALARGVTMGKFRKITIPGRGKGGSAVGEGVVVVDDWKDRLNRETALPEELREKYIALMNANPTSPTVSVASLTREEIRMLVTAGFLTNPAALSSGGNLSSRSTGVSLAAISKAGSLAPSGTLAAVGGYGAINDSGGGGSALSAAAAQPRTSMGQSKDMMTFSLPSMGPYLKLLTEARAHLLFLLKQLSPRHREATLDLLREKWDGNVPNDAISNAKRSRGEWSGVLPGKTKRWRDFYGLEFAWILAECVGSGLIELFDTGSVGIAVRGT